QHATWETLTCERAHLRALIEPVLEHLVRLQLHGQRLVHLPPQQPVTLLARHEPRLGEPLSCYARLERKGNLRGHRRRDHSKNQEEGLDALVLLGVVTVCAADHATTSS